MVCGQSGRLEAGKGEEETLEQWRRLLLLCDYVSVGTLLDAVVSDRMLDVMSLCCCWLPGRVALKPSSMKKMRCSVPSGHQTTLSADDHPVALWQCAASGYPNVDAVRALRNDLGHVQALRAA